MTFYQQLALCRFMNKVVHKLKSTTQNQQILKLTKFSIEQSQYSNQITKILYNLREITQSYQADITIIMKITFNCIRFFFQFTQYDKKLFISIIANTSTYFPESSIHFIPFIQQNFLPCQIIQLFDPETDKENLLSTFFRLLMNLSKQLKYVQQNGIYISFLAIYGQVYQFFIDSPTDLRMRFFQGRQDASQNFTSTVKNLIVGNIEFIPSSNLGSLFLSLCDLTDSYILLERCLEYLPDSDSVIEKFVQQFDDYSYNKNYIKLLLVFSKNEILNLDFDILVIQILSLSEHSSIIDQILCFQNILRDGEWDHILSFEWDPADGEWDFLQWAQ